MTQENEQPPAEPNGKDFSGLVTVGVIGYVQSETPEGTLEEIFRLAGETRSISEVTDSNSWSSYAQYRRLLEAVGSVLDGPRTLSLIGSHIFDSIRTPEIASSLAALGSPAAVYAILPSLSPTPVVELQTESLGPDEYQIRLRLLADFEPFVENCTLLMGLFAGIPRIFGLPDATIVRESCQCEGASWCQARFRWAAVDDAAEQLARAELRARLSEARLEGLQDTVAELVSGEELGTVLTRVVAAIRRAVPALSYVLDIAPSATTDRWICSEGFSSSEEIDDVTRSAGTSPPYPNVCDVDVVSDGHHYGRLVVTRNETASFGPLERSVLESYARLAASAIRNARLLDEIRHQSLHDGLTGLPNRVLIMDRVNQALSRARRAHYDVAVLFVDLDGFKKINDTFGHGVGDELLQAVASRFNGVLRDADTVGRLGGDEFIVLTEGLALAAGPELVAERLLDVFAEPFHMSGHGGATVRISASIGIAMGLRDNAEEFLRDADIALYAAKDAGKKCFVVFEDEMHTNVRSRHQLELDLLAAIGTDQFFLLYQPIFDLADMSVVGVEALLRWTHPNRGLLLPDDFLHALDASGLIVPVGRWVLLEACQQAAVWRRQGRLARMSVNISGRQMEADSLLDDVRNALEGSGLPPGDLTLEITESSLMRDAKNAQARLTALKSLGVRIAVDDFGTGYSALAYLHQFPIDSLKIDRSFISSTAQTPEGDALLHTLMQLGKALHLETLAEGIEKSGQLTQLQAEECDVGQGFLFARPLPAAEVEVFLATSPSSAPGAL